MADIELHDLRQRGDRARRCRSRVRVRRGIRARASGSGPRRRAAGRIRNRRAPESPCASASHQAPVCSSTTGAPRSALAFKASPDGSMNIETRIPARASSATKGFSARKPPTTSRPPSVVRSVRFSGTRQQACGRMRSAMSSIASVAAISKLSGLRDRGLEAAHVVVVDVAPVLAQMRGDPVGAGFDGDQGGADRDREARRRARCGRSRHDRR